MKVKLYKS